jgi:alkyl sulfatase BDS1-like metallo-beta-lactamase superfamily hydrolase
MRSALLALVLFTLACGDEPPLVVSTEPGSQGNTPPTERTARDNAAVADALPLDEDEDFADSARGLIAREEPLVIRGADGNVIWDMAGYAFEQGDAPASVNPSLWRQTRLNNQHGLYQVAERIYQVRGYDLANMSIIVGDAGWIVVDPLTANETSAAALALARKHLGDAPIVAVIVTHSHIDHFGGIEGIVTEDDLSSGRVRLIAPKTFLEEATSENVLAGIAMGRRSAYMYGMPLERSPRGHVGSGLGKAPARGTFGILPPTDIIDHTGQELELDGVRFVFQYAPDSEAPAELTFYLPKWKAWCGAEIVSHTQHNLYTLRGAQVRDAVLWSGYIDEAIHRFDGMEILFASHHWPRWGNERIVDYLKKQRDLYRYIHDQTLRMANRGMTPKEIAEEIQLPPSLESFFPDRGYYGTVRHNAKAVYQRYFGWYDGNPANLNPLPPEPQAKKYVELMGGQAAGIEKARAAHDAGEYRWAATVLNHLVFANPSDVTARELLASTYDQLGYQAESGPWRDVYLTAALELRHGVGKAPIDLSSAAGLLLYLPIHRFFDAMAVRVDGPKAADQEMVFNFTFTDAGENHVLTLENGVLHHREAPPVEDANATVKLTREVWVGLVTRTIPIREIAFSDQLEIEGSATDLVGLFRLLDNPSPDFDIVTP